MTTDPALRALCPVCGTPGRIVSSDEGTSHFAAEAAPLDVRAVLTKALPEAPMPWYDESNPDYTEAIDFLVAALAATSREATPLDTDALAKAIAMVEVTRAQVEGYVWEGPERTWFDGYAEDIAEQYRLLTSHV